MNFFPTAERDLDGVSLPSYLDSYYFATLFEDPDPDPSIIMQK